MLRYFVIFTILALAYGKLYPRIIGGKSINISRVPYVVSLRYPSDPEFQCGGSILSSKWILTAGHCINGTKGDLIVRAGSNYPNHGGISRKADDAIVHELFDNSGNNYVSNDIALVRLGEPLIAGEGYTISSIGLDQSKSRRNSNNELALVLGWGETGWRDYDKHLQSATVLTISKKRCDATYEKRYEAPLVEGKICAGYLGHGKIDSCYGDSGGPLVIDDRLVGIVSQGFSCALADYPGLYTEVCYYRQWITDTMKNYKKKNA